MNNEYEKNLALANSLGFPDACCLACNEMSGEGAESQVCKRCIEATTEFSAAFNAFITTCDKVRQ